jgi:hypothetical protein
MRALKILALFALVATIGRHESPAIGQTPYVSSTPVSGSFPLAANRATASIYVDAADWPGVIRAAGDLQADVRRVTNLTPSVLHDEKGLPASVVLIGTVGKSAVIDRLAREKKIDVSAIAGKWESFFLETVSNPLPGVSSALVIAGSDKRGTIYGIYDLSEQIGVSPWYWWADVTPEHRDALYIRAGKYRQGEPSVKYRGIFLNDEKPDLDFWVRAKYGERPSPTGSGTVANFNSAFYGRMFEVILRLKGNYLWPAMWNNAFAEDDPDNPRLADYYGVVMGSSHQEPMLRAQKEWDWHYRPTHNRWNYAIHPDVLNEFWRSGIRARKNFEAIYTIGLRGEDDTAMTQTAAEGMALLEKIVDVQRRMIAEEINPDVTKVPQLWCLYKEVQGYYENGLRVPDDVTLLWAEDNWGDVRRLPTAEERKRPGGAGVYYHFDYHGGPRSYQWIDTNPIAKIWDQMSLAKQYGADRIWIVNVGHFKGYEFPTEYFMRLAWDTSRWTNENIGDYTRMWAEREFGKEFGAGAAEIIAKYTKYNGRRKPELLEPTTYSLVNFQEAENIVADFNALVAKAEAIHARLPESKRDAFYQLALFPAKAAAQVNEMYLAAGLNALYASQGRAAANDMAARTRALFQADADLMMFFNKTFAGGKWDHFMDQSHIGYTSWQDPPANTLNAIRFAQYNPPVEAGLGVAVEGSTAAWPAAAGAPGPIIPQFDALNRQRRYIDVFNRGRTAFEFSARASDPWITLSESGGAIEKEKRLWLTIDWNRAPQGAASGSVRIAGAGREVTVALSALNPTDVSRATLKGFVETAGYVSIEPEHFSRNIDAGDNRWIRIEDYGRTLSGMRATGPVDAPAATPGKDAPRLEYAMYLFTPGQVTTTLTLSPTLNFMPGRPLRVAVSFDDETPQVVTIVPANYNAQNGNRDWEESVRNNARFVTTTHTATGRGYHTLKVWMVDPAVVVQKIVTHTSASSRPASYLGPPETYRGN